MPRQSVQNILLDEVKELRKETSEQSKTLAMATATLKNIETQTTATNGRVTKLEARQNFQRGGIYVLYLIIAIVVVPLFIAWISKQ